jgi:hypothetical protein
MLLGMSNLGTDSSNALPSHGGLFLFSLKDHCTTVVVRCRTIMEQWFVHGCSLGFLLLLVSLSYHRQLPSWRWCFDCCSFTANDLKVDSCVSYY